MNISFQVRGPSKDTIAEGGDYMATISQKEDLLNVQLLRCTDIDDRNNRMKNIRLHSHSIHNLIPIAIYF